MTTNFIKFKLIGLCSRLFDLYIYFYIFNLRIYLYLFIHLCSIHPFIILHLYQSINQSADQLINQSICASVYPSVRLNIPLCSYLPISLRVYIIVITSVSGCAVPYLANNTSPPYWLHSPLPVFSPAALFTRQIPRTRTLGCGFPCSHAYLACPDTSRERRELTPRLHESLPVNIACITQSRMFFSRPTSEFFPPLLETRSKSCKKILLCFFLSVDTHGRQD